MTVKGVLKEVLIPSSGLSFLSMIFGIFGFITVIHYGFQVSLDKLLSDGVDIWGAILLRATEPLDRFAVDHINPVLMGIFPFIIEIKETWRFVFVVLGLYFTSSVWPSIRLGHYGTAIFLSAIGLFSALMASIFASVRSETLLAQCILSITFTIVSILIFEALLSIWFATFHRNTVKRVFHLRERGEGWLRYVQADIFAQVIIGFSVFIIFIFLTVATKVYLIDWAQLLITFLTVFLYIIVYATIAYIALSNHPKSDRYNAFMAVRAVRIGAASVRVVAWSLFVVGLSLLKKHLDIPF